MKNNLTLNYDSRLCRLEFRPIDDDPERVVKLLKDNNYNMIISSATIGYGWALFDSKIRPPAPKMNPKYIPELISLCHKNDIMVLSWGCFNIQDVRYDKENYVPIKMYPQWQQKYIDEVGHKTSEEANSVGMCMFSTPYREHLADFHDEIMDLGFDGMWFDGFAATGMPGMDISCVCDACSEHFKKDSGENLPQKINWNDKPFLKWIDWRGNQMIEAAQYLNTRVKNRFPDAVVHFNTHSFPKPGISYQRGIPLQQMPFGASQHSGLGPTNGIQQNPIQSKIAHAQNRKHSDIWQPFFSAREQVFAHHIPPSQTNMMLHSMLAVAHGIYPWGGGPDNHIYIMKDVNYQTQKRLPVFGGEDVDYIGLIVSDRTKDFYGHRTNIENATDKYRHNILGIDSMLSQHHLLNNIVFDKDIDTADLNNYKVLILGNTTCISSAGITALKNWVHNGGTLIATYETSLYDEWGERLDDFSLADLFGIKYVESIIEKPMQGDPFLPENLNNIAIRSLELKNPDLNNGQKNAIFYGSFTKFNIINEDVKIIAFKPTETMSHNEGGFSKVSIGDEEPRIIERNYGKGKVIYFATDIGLAYFDWPEKNTRTVFSNIITSSVIPPIVIDAPTTTITTAKIKNNKLIVHLVNLPHATNRAVNYNQKLVVDEITPIHNIKITLNQFTSTKATSFSNQKKLTIKNNQNGKSYVNLPVLDIHEAIIFDL